jgi:ribonucleoside-diphosphate reductase alpha chain
MRWLVRAAAYRGKWIDQAQSLNIFFRSSSGKDLSEVYFYAWRMGLKTSYYLRTLAATQVEKSTVSTQEFGSTHKRGKDIKVEGKAENTPAQEVVLQASMPLGGSSAPRAEIRLHRAPEVMCESCQ